ncbi:hypothetical protein [Parabacteroides sp. Marseille-P3160]|uniref:hypothetical protein n=1 Tax=Parabacteroides sp. Marseille-P3160 TaxID=1917887 RepID=UPI00135AF639|nr:hypothetical protein [Parabacteroides sp. Marseille-P3160]
MFRIDLSHFAESEWREACLSSEPEMMFKAPGSDEFLPEWVMYFERLDLPIPEGEPGD